MSHFRPRSSIRSRVALLASHRFPRRVVLDQYFMHVDEPVLAIPAPRRSKVAAAD